MTTLVQAIQDLVLISTLNQNRRKSAIIRMRLSQLPQSNQIVLQDSLKLNVKSPRQNIRTNVKHNVMTKPKLGTHAISPNVVLTKHQSHLYSMITKLPGQSIHLIQFIKYNGEAKFLSSISMHQPFAYFQLHRFIITLRCST